MKKILFIGIAVILAVFLITCDAFFPKEDEEVEYTDVVYSEDGSAITLYLDGVGVPRTAAQRAMSTRLARMAYDYIEVIFVGPGGTTVARAEWELGQSAGISGVARGTAPTGVDYAFVAATVGSAPATQTTVPDPGAGLGVALMAVGRKDGKTLLGIGEIMEVDNSASRPDGSLFAAFEGGWDDDTGEPNTHITTILPATKSVTFYITAIKTGLLVGGEVAVGTTPATGEFVNTYGIQTDSLVFTDTTIKTGSKRSTLGGIDYPLYSLPEAAADAEQKGTYTFYGAAEKYMGQLILNRTRATAWTQTPKTVSPLLDVEMRMPRFMDGGSYKQPKAYLDTRSTAESLDYGHAPLSLFSNVVNLVFTHVGSSTGMYSFFIDIPVVLFTKATGTNGGNIPGIVWHVRTGLGSELYSIDDGLASGGCVLMGIGVADLDWLEIEWAFVK